MPLENKCSVLVVGGGGYLGSHMVKRLLPGKYAVTILDDFSTGHRDAIVGGTLIEGSLSDTVLLDRIFSGNRFDAVMHFASFIQVGESVAQPARYYRNNLINTINLLDAMTRHGVSRFVFSSTAAIFGEPLYVPIDEKHPVSPINPYGCSKAMLEQVLRDYDKAYGLKSVCLRYFNACGADPDGELGERHEPETHLIPLALQAVLGQRGPLTVFGNDYDTRDGTCIRDYVHVMDLCEAHINALDWLNSGGESAAFNLGNGQGFSVAEVLETVGSVTSIPVPVRYGPRRAGDPAQLVANSSRAHQMLKWSPRYSDLQTIISHAWAWERKMAGHNIVVSC